jgi:hypothetical protein
MKSTKKQFAAWGALAFSMLYCGIASVVIGALIQKNIVSDFTIVGFSFFKNAGFFALVLILMGFCFRWVALYFGRKLTCEQCSGLVLPADRYGRRGLEFFPVLSAVLGHSTSPTCFKVRHTPSNEESK